MRGIRFNVERSGSGEAFGTSVRRQSQADSWQRLSRMKSVFRSPEAPTSNSFGSRSGRGIWFDDERSSSGEEFATPDGKTSRANSRSRLDKLESYSRRYEGSRIRGYSVSSRRGSRQRQHHRDSSDPSSDQLGDERYPRMPRRRDLSPYGWPDSLGQMKAVPKKREWR